MRYSADRHWWGVLVPLALALGCGRRAPVPLTAVPVDTASLPAPERATGWVTDEVVDYHWLPNEAPYRLIVEHPLDSTPHGTYAGRLRIETPFGYTLLLEDTLGDGGVAREPVRARDSLLTRYNLFKTNFVYVIPSLTGPGGVPMLLVSGWGYASDPSSFWLIALDASGAPQKVMDLVRFDPAEITDLNGDGNPEVLGWQVLSQGVGADVNGCSVASYAPISVYQLLGEPLPIARYDAALTATYNRAHYVWTGEWADTSPNVAECPGGQYRVVESAK